MPNWCYNNIDIIGDRDELQRFVDATKTTTEEGTVQHGLNHLFPIPAELQATPSAWYGDAEKQAEQTALEQANIAKYGYKDWYDWQYARWGTKWGDCDTDLLDEDPFVTPDGRSHIRFVFQTPWGPPLEGIAHITTLFPTLEFGIAYYEDGMDFYGFCTFVDGEPIDNCNQISDIPGIAELDARYEEEEEDIWAERNDLICRARDELAESAGF